MPRIGPTPTVVNDYNPGRENKAIGVLDMPSGEDSGYIFRSLIFDHAVDLVWLKPHAIGISVTDLYLLHMQRIYWHPLNPNLRSPDKASKREQPPH